MYNASYLVGPSDHPVLVQVVISYLDEIFFHNKDNH